MRTLLEEKCKIKLSSANKERERERKPFSLVISYYFANLKKSKRNSLGEIAWALSFAFIDYSKLKPSLPDTVFLFKMLILSKASGGLSVVV